MKIVFILPGRARSGAIKSTAIAANALLARGHKVAILYRKARLTPKKVIRGIVKKLLFKGRYDWLGIFQGPISDYGDITECSFESDKIIVGVGMWCSVQLGRLNHTRNPKLQYIRGLTPWLPELMQEALSLPIPKVVVSSNMPQEVKKYGGGEVLAIIPNGIKQDEYYPSVSESERNGIGTIYSSNPAKDPKTTVKVLIKLKQELPNIPQYIFGTMARPKAIPRTDYKRYPSVKQARWRYSRSKVWILASCTEGFSGTVLEAMACGCAVVATNCGGMRDIINDGENGLLVEVGNVEQIVDRVKLLLNNTNLRQQLVNNAKKTIKKLTWKKSVDLLENTLIKNFC